MNLEEVSKLKNITDSFYVSITHKNSICRYVTPVYRANMSKKLYRPIAIKLYTNPNTFKVYDYSLICKFLLTMNRIDNTLLDAFIETYDYRVKSYDIADITLEQAQEIINKNTLLLNELNNRLQEDDLLDKLNL